MPIPTVQNQQKKSNYGNWIQLGILLITLTALYFDQANRVQNFQNEVSERLARVESRLDGNDQWRSDMLERLNNIQQELIKQDLERFGK